MTATASNIITFHPSVPEENIAAAELPVTYSQARDALARCYDMDECQTWADKAKALASYAKQAQDEGLRVMATKIQGRAIRRCGELMKQIEPGQGAHWESKREGTLPSISRTQAAEDAGLSEWQRKTALRVANVPEDLFEEWIESDDPPTVTQLAELGKGSKPVTPIIDLEGIDPELFSQATAMGGMLNEMVEWFSRHDPQKVSLGFSPWEAKKHEAKREFIESWLDELFNCLSKRHA